MSNRLRMANLHAIIGLLEQKWSYRRISRELGVDRDTVARYDRLRQSWSKPAISTAGSETSGDPNAAISTAGSMPPPGDLVFVETSGRLPGRPSQCNPFTDVIKKIWIGRDCGGKSCPILIQVLNRFNNKTPGSITGLKILLTATGQKAVDTFYR